MKCKCLLVIGVLIAGFYSCKKAAPIPADSALIIGKWYFVSQFSVLYHDNVQLSTFTKTNFTNVDFVEYYNDGSGYYSKSTTEGPSLSEFSYTVSGATITQYSGTENSGIPETIKSITSTGLSVHVVQLVPDPNDPTVTDTEVDDFTYTR
ncbi:MAG TPA: hypothetical protein VFE53_07190 [Mucilaginibacter sp.]|jgi:hypothetical protein|nr:hypothetical protein [Mucilaginibacter sp.]